MTINWKMIVQSVATMTIVVCLNKIFGTPMSFEAVLLLTILGNSWVK